MSLTRTTARVTGLLAMSSASRARPGSMRAAVSDHGFRGVSHSAKYPVLQASADHIVD
jgi:hypothetical protein